MTNQNEINELRVQRLLDKEKSRKWFIEMQNRGYEPEYIADEYDSKEHWWIVWAFKEVRGEYHELQRKSK